MLLYEYMTREKEMKTGIGIALGFILGLLLGNVVLGLILGTSFGLVWGYTDHMLTGHHKTHTKKASTTRSPKKKKAKSRKR